MDFSTIRFKIVNKHQSEYKLAEVISIISHQLKTPISVIKGYLEVLASKDLGEINPKQKEYLNFALANVDRMILLVKDFLEISRIEENQLKLKKEPTDLEKIVQEVIDELSPVASAKNCEIHFQTRTQLPVLNIDRLKIKQVISNLISNAIDYKKTRGEVEISLKKQGEETIFCCQDNGIGIPDDEKAKIFTKFYRNDNAMIMAPGGSGVGLFISKAIIDASRGKIWFESQKDRGSTFCFSLPIS